MSKEFSEQETSLITARTPLKSMPVGSLFFTHGERVGQELPLTRDTFFIGRSKNNNLMLNDKSASRKHAVINMLEGEYIISDLNSLKGTYVNGKKIEECTLKPGDIINIGENRMQFRLVTPSGIWISPSRRSGAWYVLITLIVGIAIGVGAWFVAQKIGSSRFPEDKLKSIEAHYIKGVDYYNMDRNVSAAREEWKQIMELDPEKKTGFAVKAEKLLKSTEGSKPSE